MAYKKSNPNGQATMANSEPVVIASNQSAVPVTGTITAVTAITNALPSGSNVIGHVISDTGSTTAVTGNVTAVQATGSNLHVVVDTAPTTAITAASLPLPTGAATLAKQPALGTAGTASADVITVQGIASMTALKVDGSAVTQPVSGTVTATISSNATVDVNRIAGTTTSVDNGTADNGTQRVTIASDSTGQIIAVGNVAAASSDSGNPVKIGAVGKTANPTAVTDGQRTNIISDKVGRQVVVTAIRDLVADQNTTITSTTAATVVVTAVASTFLDLTALVLTNISATGSEVQLLDDDGTTVRMVFFIPAFETRGIVFTTPFTQPTVNKTWKIKTVTSIASLKVTAQFIKNI